MSLCQKQRKERKGLRCTVFRMHWWHTIAIIEIIERQMPLARNRRITKTENCMLLFSRHSMTPRLSKKTQTFAMSSVYRVSCPDIEGMEERRLCRHSCQNYDPARLAKSPKTPETRKPEKKKMQNPAPRVGPPRYEKKKKTKMAQKEKPLYPPPPRKNYNYSSPRIFFL